MFNNGFYPTPADVAARMISKAKKNEYRAFRFGTILEPSAGKGDILDALKKDYDIRRIVFDSDVRHSNVDCVEINQDLQSILISKGYNVVASDFLSFNPVKHYDLIMMNPPFDKGAAHLLHAISILEKQKVGTLVCLLNAETIRNPYSNERKELKQKLEDMQADIEFIQNAFSSAERKTNVDIAMIHCEVKSDYKKYDVFKDAQFKAQKITLEQFESAAGQMVDREKVLHFLVEQYNTDVQLLKSLCESIHALNANFGQALTEDSYKRLYDVKDVDFNTVLHSINLAYWEEVIKMGTFSKYLTKEAYSSFRKKLNSQSDMVFCIENILIVKHMLANTFMENIKISAMNIFDWACQGHMESYSKNIHYYNGWKTNNAYKINKKIIVRLNMYSDIWNGFGYSYSQEGELNDICRVMSYFDGFAEFAHFGRDLKLDESTGIAENEYIYVDAKKKGTTHISFKRLDLLEKFNYFAAKEKNWLPSDEARSQSVHAYTQYDDIMDIIFKNSDRPTAGAELLRLPIGA